MVATSRSPAPLATVLLVEDDDSLRDMLRRTLERAGFAVTTAAHGVDALARFRERAVELVVTDILLPEMDGFDLIRRLRRESPKLPIVALSGISDSPNFRKLALQSGARVALSKPVDRTHLIDLLRRIAAERSQG